MLHDYLYGDGYDYEGFYVPSHEYYRWKRQEELRRRWELEQAYRREQQERHLRNLRLREEQARQMRRRRELELHDALAEQRLFEDDAESEEGAQPKYQLVRGIDGLIYRVPLCRGETGKSQNLPAMRRPTVEKAKPPQVQSKESSDHLSHIPGPVVSRNKSMPADVSKLATEAPLDKESRGRVVVDVRVPEAKDSKKGRNRRKVTVVVEDASDSEEENDDLKSVWRNRRPSPGQWIEPVDF